MNWKLIRFIDIFLGILLLQVVSLTRSPRKKTAIRRTDVTTILLVKFWGIGNLMMMIPSLQALRDTYPEARIHLLTLESNRDAVEMVRGVDQVFTVDTSRFGSFIVSTRNAIAALSRNRYDIAIDFEQFARFSVLISCLLGARELIGFRTQGQHRHHVFTTAVPYDNTLHTTRSFFSLAKEAGVPDAFPAQITLAAMGEILGTGEGLISRFGILSDDLIILMHVGTSDNFSERRWPAACYADLANLLMRDGKCRVIFTGLKEESFLVREIFQNLEGPSAAIDASGQLSFSEYFGLIAVSDLVISADTSAVHLASVVGVPVVGLYGPNTPLLYGPWGPRGYAIYQPPECSPCITNFNAKIHTCRHPSGKGACMSSITVQQVHLLIHEEQLCGPVPRRRTAFREAS